MEVLSVQNQYPAHFALATGKYQNPFPFLQEKDTENQLLGSKNQYCKGFLI